MFILSIKNIPDKLDIKELKELFGEKGKIINTTLVSKFGFVEFEDEETLDYWLEKENIKYKGNILELGKG
jgi:RNA recognition motif-containing protein